MYEHLCILFSRPNQERKNLVQIHLEFKSQDSMKIFTFAMIAFSFANYKLQICVWKFTSFVYALVFFLSRAYMQNTSDHGTKLNFMRFISVEKKIETLDFIWSVTLYNYVNKIGTFALVCEQIFPIIHTQRHITSFRCHSFFSHTHTNIWIMCLIIFNRQQFPFKSSPNGFHIYCSVCG